MKRPGYFFNILLLSVLCLCYSGLKAQSGDLSRIYKALDKGRKVEDLTIGVIGGSITQGYAASTENKRWANLVADWWTEKFPDSNVNLINAGWGGTGSDIGTHRLYDDLLSKSPDFIVVEYSVNDSEGELAEKMMEGILQQILLAENTPGVCVLMLKQDNGVTAQASHKKVANHYNVPYVSFADLIDEAVAEDGVGLSSIFVDGLHPNDVGMAYIAGFVTGKLDSIYTILPAGDNLPEISTSLPEPLFGTTFSNSFQYFTNNIIPLNNIGWNTEAYGWKATEPNKQIDFQVTGNAVSLIFTQNNSSDRGKAQVWVDNGMPITIDAWMSDDWGTKYAYALVEEGLEDGNHTLHIKTIPESSTNGNTVNISRIMVAGNVGSVAPIGHFNCFNKGVVNNEVILDASESFDPDGQAIEEYKWNVGQKPDGSSPQIQSVNDSVFSFVTDVGGTYVVRLVVVSGREESVPFQREITIRSSNAKPVAVVGNDTLSAIKRFYLDGSSSYDDDNDALVFNWTLIDKPTQSNTEIMGVDLKRAQVKFDSEGIYQFGLVVFDSIHYSDTAYLQVEVRQDYSGLFNVSKKKDVIVYPNPSSQTAFVKFSLSELSDVTVSLLELSGRKIYQDNLKNIGPGEQIYQINFCGHNLKPGNYLLQIRNDDIVQVRRIALTH